MIDHSEDPSAWLWRELAAALGPERAADLRKRHTEVRAAYTQFAAQRRIARQTRRLVERLTTAERAQDAQAATRARKALRTAQRRQHERNL